MASDVLLQQCSRRKLLTGMAATSTCVIAPGDAFASAADRFGLTPVCLTSDSDLLEALQSYLARNVGAPVERILKRT